MISLFTWFDTFFIILFIFYFIILVILFFNLFLIMWYLLNNCLRYFLDYFNWWCILKNCLRLTRFWLLCWLYLILIIQDFPFLFLLSFQFFVPGIFSTSFLFFNLLLTLFFFCLVSFFHFNFVSRLLILLSHIFKFFSFASCCHALSSWCTYFLLWHSVRHSWFWSSACRYLWLPFRLP